MRAALRAPSPQDAAPSTSWLTSPGTARAHPAAAPRANMTNHVLVGTAVSGAAHSPAGLAEEGTWRCRAAALNGRLARHREERATKEPKEADWLALQVYRATLHMCEIGVGQLVDVGVCP